VVVVLAAVVGIRPLDSADTTGLATLTVMLVVRGRIFLGSFAAIHRAGAVPSVESAACSWDIEAKRLEDIEKNSEEQAEAYSEDWWQRELAQLAKLTQKQGTKPGSVGCNGYDRTVPVARWLFLPKLETRNRSGGKSLPGA
jgi:hypothetical protein